MLARYCAIQVSRLKSFSTTISVHIIVIMVKNLLNKSQKLLSRQQSGILSAAIVITGSSLLSAILGLVRNRLLISRFFGTPTLQMQLDAYLVAFKLPELAFQLLVIGAVSAAFIPVFTKYKKRSLEDANFIASSMMNIVLLVFSVISIVIFIWAEGFNKLITSSEFSPDQVLLAANLSRVMIVAQFFFAISNFLSGIIQANQRFLIPALSPIAYNVGIIIGIVGLTPVIGIYGPAIGVVLGSCLHLLMQLPLSRQLGFHYSFKIDLKHVGVREMLRLIPPRTLAISVNQLEIFASVYFATALGTGSLVIINLAQQLMTAPTRIFSVPLGQASLPFLSEQVSQDNMAGFKNTLISSFHHIMFLTLPASIVLLILRIPLVRLAYGSSAFPWDATLLTGRAVAILCIGLFAQGSIHILVRAFYALHNTKTPLLVALISVLTNIVISYISVFTYKTGVLGLAAAITISTIIHFIILASLLWRQIGGISWSEVLKNPLKITLASSIMGISLWIPMRLLDQFVFDTTRTIPLIMLTLVVACIGAVAFLYLSYHMHIPEVTSYMGLFKKIGNWRQVLTASDEIIENPSLSEEISRT